MNSNEKGQVVQPTVGRIVHYIPSPEEQAKRKGAGCNGANPIPAIVTQVFPNSWKQESYTGINLTLFPADGSTLPRFSAPHITTAQEQEGCWVWPTVQEAGK